MKRMPTVIGFAVFLSQAPASAQKIPPHADFRATPPEPKLLAGDVDSAAEKDVIDFQSRLIDAEARNYDR